MKIFLLPDLGEGLPDAEIIEWHVAEGDTIKVDDPLVSMETAKAVVEVPSPYTGKVCKQFGRAGDIMETGKPLAGFEPEDQVDELIGTPLSDPGVSPATVVGSMKTSDTIIRDNLTKIGSVKVTPAVRALARKLKVDLARITPTGKDGVVVRADVENASRKSADFPATAGPHGGEWEPVRGTRRSMARIMSESHSQVVATCIMDDADIHQWAEDQDLTVRLLRSLWAGARQEAGLNAWYDPLQNQRLIHTGMAVGVAIDTDDGLFVASLKNVHTASGDEIRDSIRQLRDGVEKRSIPSEDLKGYTIMLSNFGMFAGRYATPILNPPCVCIVAAGKTRLQVAPSADSFAVHRVIPLSLTFDHRACTGGEAARFFKAMIDDLTLPE